jgi:hypothetical protein
MVKEYWGTFWAVVALTSPGVTQFALMGIMIGITGKIFNFFTIAIMSYGLAYYIFVELIHARLKTYIEND